MWLQSWFLWGSYGVGKTGLAVGFLRHWLEESQDVPALFRTTPDVLAEIRATYNKEDGAESEEAVIKRYATAPLLVLDDLGAEQIRAANQDWAQDRLYRIIGQRHANELTTVFTANIDIEEVARRLGERLAWRIVEMCGKGHIIHVVGPNLRDVP